MRYGGPFRHTVVKIFQCWACIIRPSVNWSILVVERNQASSAIITLVVILNLLEMLDFVPFESRCYTFFV